MHKVYYRYNNDKGRYERVYPTFKQRAIGKLVHFLSSLVMMLIMVVLAVWAYEEYWLPIQKNKAESGLLKKCEELELQLNNVYRVTSRLSERDQNLFRVMVQAEPLENEGLTDLNVTELRDSSNEVIVAAIEKQVKKLENRVLSLSASYDEVGSMFLNQGGKWLSVPSIKPVRNMDLLNLSSGYGMRVDPITGEPKMHNGLDFVATLGTDVLAVGAGSVAFADWRDGYGYTVIVDHGYGYETLYGHLDRLLVRKGEAVGRGDVVGLVGSSGRSTGPHLHYEVHLQGRTVNPVHFFSKELTPQQYNQLLRESTLRAGTFD